jgi:phytoene synthase
MRGRIYLPVSELQQFDVKAHEILKRTYSDRFVALMRSRPARPPACTTKRWPCCPRPTAAPKSPA